MADDDARRPGQDGVPDGSGQDGGQGRDRRDPGGTGRDLDAEFDAMVNGLEMPGLDGLDGLDHAGPADPEGAGTGPAGDPETTGPDRPGSGGPAQHVVGVDPADVPHNSYRDPASSAGPARGGAAGGVPGFSDADRADLDALGRDEAAGMPRAVKVAVVLTPLASAEALAGLCAMSGLACWVVPARSGAYAVKEFVSAHAEWDVAELLGGMESEPAEAAELAGTLSRLARGGVVLLTADLATDVGIESGLSGHITARHYVSGEAGEETSAGLVMSAVDASVEDVLFGILKAAEVPGALDTTNLPTGRAFRLFGRGLRRPRGQGGSTR